MKTIEFLINFIATIVFSYAGCINSLEFSTNSLAVFLTNAVLCSHGGGMIWRDLTLSLMTHNAYSPSVLTSYDTWIAASIGFLIFMNRRRCSMSTVLPNNRKLLLLYRMTDYAGVGLIAHSGVTRAFYVYSIRHFAVLVYAGTFSAIGGGLLSLFLFSDKKVSRLINNIRYYITALTAAFLATSYKTLNIEDKYTAVLISAFCALVPIAEVLISNLSEIVLFKVYIPLYRLHKPVSYPRNRYSFNIIKHILNPYRGIHSYSVICTYCNKSICEYVITNIAC